MLALGLPTAVVSQQEGPPPGSCSRNRPVAAVAQMLAVNYLVNRFDALVLDEDFARVGFESWSRNLRLGWEWDENAFGTNMFMHPQHGGMYFNAARANCLSFWESIPLAFLGSWTWEYFGETHRPSLNDFFMTSLGGIAVGEMLHRVSASIRRSDAQGSSRLSREIAATLFDPVGGLNRLVRGEWKREPSRPAGNDDGLYLVRLAAGGRRVRESGSANQYSSTVLVDLSYGDAFSQPYEAPYDAFTVQVQVSPGGGGLNMLRGVGRLYGRHLGGTTAETGHRFVLNQRFEYLDNPVHRFGEQALEGGILSRWSLGSDLGLRTEAVLAATVLGAIDGPDAGTGERSYDFGPGLGANVEVTLEHRGIGYLTLYNRFRYLHSVSGARADHGVLFTGIAGVVPITRGLGIGAYLSQDDRTSRYPGRADDRRSYFEGRLFLTWTAAGISDGVSP